MRTVNPQKHAESKKRILDAARRLFAAQGVKETSMAQVAKACRVTKATLYHYYKGKEDILSGIFDMSIADREKFIDTVKMQGSLEETLVEIARAYLRLIEGREMMEMMKIFQTEGMKSLDICRRYNEMVRARMDGYIRLGMERGVLPDVDRSILRNVVFTFFGALEHHFIHSHILKCDFVSGGDEGYVQFLSRMFTRTLETLAKMAQEGRISKSGVTPS